MRRVAIMTEVNEPFESTRDRIWDLTGTVLDWEKLEALIDSFLY